MSNRGLRLVGAALFVGGIWILATHGTSLAALVLGAAGAYCWTMGREGAS